MESSGFGDNEAVAAITDAGLVSAWLRNPTGRDIRTLPAGSHASLSQTALNAHVNGFAAAAATSPYISLSAGTVELDPGKTTTTVYPALKTALRFATNTGRQSGYVFRLWTLVSPKDCPELPGFAEEVRELNIFQQWATFHHEGEIAAKLFVPARQIQMVAKFDSGQRLLPSWPQVNADFTPPERISNVLNAV
jgi:hypothetical protein